VGVDLLLDEQAGAVTVVEINPRLTTSYLGYRQLTLPQRLAEGDLLPGGAALARTLIWPNLAANALCFSESRTIQFGPTDISAAGNRGPHGPPSDSSVVGQVPHPA
jgi:hypothetical protein